ncbi:hypothetical protein [Archaeoglobus profundus]|uniref:Uncharacterized protein n=1 Tax=Archaeoglobus profundus (strain DSM 5631 / JCM 9629 / NBRC 100127 / Av18) TaxID=572546 RepID=D2RI44_ARCPA|nr:hypothetical protein [Archaeoglobus profundus]ADB57969.1 hypothetical protein Arcpr_0908 [Archaeoglobus profundus DSM 5631]
MRMETFYQQPVRFSKVICKVQKVLRSMQQSAKDEFELNALRYIVNRLTEINFQVQFSSLIDQTGIERSAITVNDIDKIVKVGNEFKAIFELKVRRKLNGYIKVPKSQFNVLRYFSLELNVPVYYLTKLPNGMYHLLELDLLKVYNEEHVTDKYEQLNGRFVKIPISQGLLLDRKELIRELSTILAW